MNDLLHEMKVSTVYELPVRMVDSCDEFGDLYEHHVPTVLDLVGAETLDGGLDALSVDLETVRAYEHRFLDGIAWRCWALVTAWAARIADQAADHRYASGNAGQEEAS